MRRVLPLVALLVVACTAAASARAAVTLGGHGMSVTLPRGWHGLAAPGQLQAGDFPLAPGVSASPERARVPREHVHLIVWDYGPTVPYLASSFRAARPPLALGVRDLAPGPLEGFPGGDAYAVRSVSVGGELLEIVADLGPKPLARIRLRELNRVLRTLRVSPPRLVRARDGRLAWQGVALRLLAGWSGRIEVPADQHVAQLVLRARRGRVRVVLLELPGARGRHSELPLTLRRRDVVRRKGLTLARRVFSTAGRSFDLSVTIASPAALAQANRLLARLTAAPRSWTFRGCDLTLRLPGTWRAALEPRSGCYPVITLRAKRVRIVLRELRPTEHPHARILRRSGRRFAVLVSPPSAERKAATVVATLRATPRR